MRKTRTPTAVTSLVFTVITVFFWAAFEVYRALTIKPAPPVPSPVIAPLDPTLDSQTLNKLPGRLFFQESELPNTQASSQPVSTNQPTPISTEIPQASPTARPVATSSGSPSP